MTFRKHNHMAAAVLSHENLIVLKCEGFWRLSFRQSWKETSSEKTPWVFCHSLSPTFTRLFAEKCLRVAVWCNSVSSEPGDSGICVLKGEKKEMAFISFVFKWNSPDFSLLSDTLINSSMLSLYIRSWATGPWLSKPISSCCHGSAFLAPLVSRAWPITRSNTHQLPVPSVRAVKELRWSVSLWFWSACSL